MRIRKRFRKFKIRGSIYCVLVYPIHNSRFDYIQLVKSNISFDDAIDKFMKGECRITYISLKMDFDQRSTVILLKALIDQEEMFKDDFLELSSKFQNLDKKLSKALKSSKQAL